MLTNLLARSTRNKESRKNLGDIFSAKSFLLKHRDRTGCEPGYNCEELLIIHF